MTSFCEYMAGRVGNAFLKLKKVCLPSDNFLPTSDAQFGGTTIHSVECTLCDTQPVTTILW